MPRIFFSYFSQFRYSFIKSEPKFCKKGVRQCDTTKTASMLPEKNPKKQKINRQRQVDPTIIWLFDPDFSWKVYLFNFILFNLKRTDSVGKTFIWPKIQKHCTHKTLRKIKLLQFRIRWTVPEILAILNSVVEFFSRILK